MALRVRARRERLNGTSLELYTGRLGLRLSSRAFRTMCARPCSPPPFALITAHPSASAPTLHVPRAAQAPMHRIRTDLARTVPPPRPQHARTLCRPAALTWLLHTSQVRTGDSGHRRRPSSARSLRARRRRCNVARHELHFFRPSSRAGGCWPLAAWPRAVAGGSQRVS